jgi:outer membrane protein assembly factor BamA
MPRRFLAVGTFSAVLMVAGHALADDPPPVDEPPSQEPIVTEPPPPKEVDAAPRDPKVLPDFMGKKRRMRDEDIADKKEDGYFTGLPLINSDPDTGIGFGARVLYFNNGPRDDKMFEYTPYRHRVFGQAFFTTNGYQYHTVDYDAPYIADMPVRLRARVFYEKNIAANYFGAGPSSLGRLRHPGAPGQSFDSLSDYTDSLRQVRPDGTAFTRYNQYILERPSASATLERDFFGGIVRGQLGFTGSYVTVKQWTGDTVKGDRAGGESDVDARQARTRLDEDCASGLAKGCGGGFNNSLKLGIAFDTRDFEPDPNSGVFIDFTTEMSGRPLGSDFDWVRATFSPRFYWSPFPKLTDLVVAARLVGSVQTADTPIFSLSEISFTDTNLFGLGGLRTIRGYKQNRFVGRTLALANLELRWTFYEFQLKKQRFALMLAPFFDVGRVFNTIDDFELKRFRNGQGAGFRIAWNQATIIVLDYGIIREGSATYINFSHPF